MIKHIERTPNFIKQIKKLDKSYLERIEKLIRKIILNPEIGKPMQYNRKRTREVYANPFRLSYSQRNIMTERFDFDKNFYLNQLSKSRRELKSNAKPN